MAYASRTSSLWMRGPALSCLPPITTPNGVALSVSSMHGCGGFPTTTWPKCISQIRVFPRRPPRFYLTTTGKDFPPTIRASSPSTARLLTGVTPTLRVRSSFDRVLSTTIEPEHALFFLRLFVFPLLLLLPLLRLRGTSGPMGSSTGLIHFIPLRHGALQNDQPFPQPLVCLGSSLRLDLLR